jgi:para-aminobenzoate synthetase component I
LDLSKPTPQTIKQVNSVQELHTILAAERQCGDVLLLESQLPGHPSSHTSYLFAGLEKKLVWSEKYAPAACSSKHSDSVDVASTDADHLHDPWYQMAVFRSKNPGYCCGFLGYDLKNIRENLVSENHDPANLPDLWMGWPHRVYILSNIEVETLVNTNPDTIAAELRHAFPPFAIQNLRPSLSREEYIAGILQAKRHIFEGDFYEINLSHQLSADFEGDPLGLYLDMRRRGPVPFAAYLQLNQTVACCASPELFLQKRGDQLISDPIKGTRPRGGTPEADDLIGAELQYNEKERAENLMIVDLVRNDFSRVCTSGSVRVSKLFEIQKFATVFQMVSRVEGTLQPGIPPEEALAACFPMGSMTGAPKIRAMELIEQIETYRRGLYSGAIGFFTPQGDFTFNVVIRTAIVRDQKLYYATGGAITADSDPTAEWEETWVKARALGVVPGRKTKSC